MTFRLPGCSCSLGVMATESPLKDLQHSSRSRTPLIAVESNEEPQVVSVIRQLGSQLQLKNFQVDRHRGNDGLRFGRPASPIRSSPPGNPELTSRPPHLIVFSCSWIFGGIWTTTCTSGFSIDIAIDYPRHYSTVI
jgi:hypothetical protein